MRDSLSRSRVSWHSAKTAGQVEEPLPNRASKLRQELSGKQQQRTAAGELLRDLVAAELP